MLGVRPDIPRPGEAAQSAFASLSQSRTIAGILELPCAMSKSEEALFEGKRNGESPHADRLCLRDMTVYATTEDHDISFC